MKKVKARVHHTALPAGTSRGAPLPAPPHSRPPAPSGYFPLLPAPPAPPAPQQQQQGDGGGHRTRRVGAATPGDNSSSSSRGMGGIHANISPPRPGPSALTHGPAWSTLTTCRFHGLWASSGRTRLTLRRTSPLLLTRRVGAAMCPCWCLLRPALSSSPAATLRSVASRRLQRRFSMEATPSRCPMGSCTARRAVLGAVSLQLRRWRRLVHGHGGYRPHDVAPR